MERARNFLKNETNGFMASVLEPKESKLPVYLIFNCYGNVFGGRFLIPRKHRKMIVEVAKDNGGEKCCNHFDWGKMISVDVSDSDTIFSNLHNKKFIKATADFLLTNWQWQEILYFIRRNHYSIHRHWIGETDTLSLFKELLKGW